MDMCLILGHVAVECCRVSNRCILFPSTPCHLNPPDVFSLWVHFKTTSYYEFICQEQNYLIWPSHSKNFHVYHLHHCSRSRLYERHVLVHVMWICNACTAKNEQIKFYSIWKLMHWESMFGTVATSMLPLRCGTCVGVMCLPLLTQADCRKEVDALKTCLLSAIGFHIPVHQGRDMLSKTHTFASSVPLRHHVSSNWKLAPLLLGCVLSCC